MVRETVNEHSRRRSYAKTVSREASRQPARGLEQSQELIYEFFLNLVKQAPADEVLNEFKCLFIHITEIDDETVSQALHNLTFTRQEDYFRTTLKRCCYILVNNWEISRNYGAIHNLVDLFSAPSIYQDTLSHTVKRVRTWLRNFVQSDDFKQLQLFAAKHQEEPAHWHERYRAFLLAEQYANTQNPIEQRRAARIAAQKMRERFKFDLAMYVARSQSGRLKQGKLKNPTALGDETLILVRTLLARRGRFSYRNLADLFLRQTRNLSYADYKLSLIEYLLFALEDSAALKLLKQRLFNILQDLYPNCEDQIITSSLQARTCRRLIEHLTITDQAEQPAPLFISLVSQGSPLTLVALLLKLILICETSRSHLEICVGHLIRYYESFDQQECTWVINFLEVLNVALAVHAENVEYNLLKVEACSDEKSAVEAGLGASASSTRPSTAESLPASQYRIFSQRSLHNQQEIDLVDLQDVADPPETPEPSEAEAESILGQVG